MSMCRSVCHVSRVTRDTRRYKDCDSGRGLSPDPLPDPASHIMRPHHSLVSTRHQSSGQQHVTGEQVTFLMNVLTMQLILKLFGRSNIIYFSQKSNDQLTFLSLSC